MPFIPTMSFYIFKHILLIKKGSFDVIIFDALQKYASLSLDLKELTKMCVCLISKRRGDTMKLP